MRAILIVIATVILCACSASTAVVRSQVVSYDDAIEDTTNKLLVLNILRAKDKAPLHFDEIPSIHETIQATASLTGTYPFGPRPQAWTRNSFSPGMNLQISPSFEIDHLDTKDFVTGLASPIDAKFVKYWLDRGLDRRIVMLLFFSAADIVDTDANNVSRTIRVRNSPRDAIDSLKQQSMLRGGDLSDELLCDEQSDFQHYLKLINSLKTFTAHSATERRLLADHLALDAKGQMKDLNEIASLDPSKYQWFRHADNTYSIYAISSEPKTALCFADTPINFGAAAPSKQDACIQSVVEIGADDAAASHLEEAPQPSPPIAKRDTPTAYCSQFHRFLGSLDALKAAGGSTPKVELKLEIRSAGEIIQFLGDLLEYQDRLRSFIRRNPAANIKLNDPVTFGFCADDKSGNTAGGCADIFFNLRHNTCNARFTLTYRGEKYSVPNYDTPEDSSCPSTESTEASSSESKDHTLEVLSVVHQLIDLQKSAQDIRETPYVQVLP
jgi:hypothetical protein